MSVKVNIHLTLRHFTNGQAAAEVNGNRVGECLYDLVQQFPGIETRLSDKKCKLLNYLTWKAPARRNYPGRLRTGTSFFHRSSNKTFLEAPMDSKKFTNVRKKLNRTQKEMAEMLGTSIKTVHSYEQGWRKVPGHIERQAFFWSP